jgi:hypothetical protein
MSIAVMTLWGCLAMERNTMRHAERDEVAALQRLDNLRQRMVPVSTPSYPLHILTTPRVG